MFNEYNTLSAIATLGSQEIPSFHVCHNSLVQGVPSLSQNIFDDGSSVQFNSADGIPTTPPKPFDLEKAVAIFLERSREIEKNAITVDDYKALESS